MTDNLHSLVYRNRGRATNTSRGVHKENTAFYCIVKNNSAAVGFQRRKVKPEVGKNLFTLRKKTFFDCYFISVTDFPAKPQKYRKKSLSAGTYDLMYLAVRLAVCKMALPGSDPCPIILDDPLVNFDPEREKQAIKLLKELAKERQIILFTCRELSE